MDAISRLHEIRMRIEASVPQSDSYAFAAETGIACMRKRVARKLTTFWSVPWNYPLYSSLGFVEIPCETLRPELAALVSDEARRGSIVTPESSWSIDAGDLGSKKDD